MDLFESLLGSFVEAARLCHVMTPDELTQAMTTYGKMEHSYRALKLNDLYKAHKASIQTMSGKSIANYPKVVAVSCLDEPQEARLNVLVKHPDLQLIALTDLEVFIQAGGAFARVAFYDSATTWKVSSACICMMIQRAPVMSAIMWLNLN